MSLRLSVIIPTRDRAAYLRDALASIVAQDMSQELFEVVVVDNGSTDGTSVVCAEFVGKIKNFTCVFEPEPGLHAGRHRGMKESKAEILVYADDDIEAFPTWLSGVLSCFDDQKVVLAGGKDLPKFECPPPGWIERLWEENGRGEKTIASLSVLDLGDERKEIDPTYVFGCNFSIRKTALFAVGGFHPDGMPKEKQAYRGDGETYVSNEIQKRGWKALYEPKASVYHRVPRERMTIAYFRKRSFAHGISDSYADLRAGSHKVCLTYAQQCKSYAFEGKVHAAFGVALRCMRAGSFGRAMHDGHAEGYQFHQQVYAANKDVNVWVHKSTYMPAECELLKGFV
jgi:glycosyltransferase involved in cell wall biosynthesis